MVFFCYFYTEPIYPNTFPPFESSLTFCIVPACSLIIFPFKTGKAGETKVWPMQRHAYDAEDPVWLTTQLFYTNGLILSM